MTRILLLGYAPETVDYSDPALPPGLTAEKIHAAIAVAMKQFAERGWEADVCAIRPDESAGPTVVHQWVRRATIVLSSEPACACRLGASRYSKR